MRERQVRERQVRELVGGVAQVGDDDVHLTRRSNKDPHTHTHTDTSGEKGYVHRPRHNVRTQPRTFTASTPKTRCCRIPNVFRLTTSHCWYMAALVDVTMTVFGVSELSGVILRFLSGSVTVGLAPPGSGGPDPDPAAAAAGAPPRVSAAAAGACTLANCAGGLVVFVFLLTAESTYTRFCSSRTRTPNACTHTRKSVMGEEIFKRCWSSSVMANENSSEYRRKRFRLWISGRRRGERGGPRGRQARERAFGAVCFCVSCVDAGCGAYRVGGRAAWWWGRSRRSRSRGR